MLALYQLLLFGEFILQYYSRFYQRVNLFLLHLDLGLLLFDLTLLFLDGVDEHDAHPTSGSAR